MYYLCGRKSCRFPNLLIISENVLTEVISRCCNSVDGGFITTKLKMDDKQIQQIINQTRMSIDRDEAIGRQALACAAEKRILLSALEAALNECARLRTEAKVINEFHVGRDYVANQTIS